MYNQKQSGTFFMAHGVYYYIGLLICHFCHQCSILFVYAKGLTDNINDVQVSQLISLIKL